MKIPASSLKEIKTYLQNIGGYLVERNDSGYQASSRSFLLGFDYLITPFLATSADDVIPLEQIRELMLALEEGITLSPVIDADYAYLREEIESTLYQQNAVPALGALSSFEITDLPRAIDLTDVRNKSHRPILQSPRTLSPDPVVENTLIMNIRTLYVSDPDDARKFCELLSPYTSGRQKLDVSTAEMIFMYLKDKFVKFLRLNDLKGESANLTLKLWCDMSLLVLKAMKIDYTHNQMTPDLLIEMCRIDARSLTPQVTAQFHHAFTHVRENYKNPEWSNHNYHAKDLKNILSRLTSNRFFDFPDLVSFFKQKIPKQQQRKGFYRSFSEGATSDKTAEEFQLPAIQRSARAEGPIERPKSNPR